MLRVTSGIVALTSADSVAVSRLGGQIDSDGSKNLRVVNGGIDGPIGLSAAVPLLTYLWCQFARSIFGGTGEPSCWRRLAWAYVLLRVDQQKS